MSRSLNEARMRCGIPAPFRWVGVRQNSQPMGELHSQLEAFSGSLARKHFHYSVLRTEYWVAEHATCIEFSCIWLFLRTRYSAMIPRGVFSRNATRIRPSACRPGNHSRPATSRPRHQRPYSSGGATPTTSSPASSAAMLAPFVGDLDRIAPSFQINGSQIRILRTPSEFYETLKVRATMSVERAAQWLADDVAPSSTRSAVPSVAYS